MILGMEKTWFSRSLSIVVAPEPNDIVKSGLAKQSATVPVLAALKVTEATFRIPLSPEFNGKKLGEEPEELLCVI